MSFINALRKTAKSAMNSKIAGHLKKFADGGTTSTAASRPGRAAGGMVGEDLGGIDGAPAPKSLGRPGRSKGKSAKGKGKGGKGKGTTNVTVAVMPKPDVASGAPPMPPPASMPPPGPMPPPPGPGPMDMGGPPPGGPPPMMRADGGKVVKMTAGAGSGEGRLEKAEEYGSKPGRAQSAA